MFYDSNGYGIDVCGRFSFKNDTHVFFGVFCVAGTHFCLKLVYELLRVATRFWGHRGQWSARECVVLVIKK